MKIAKCEAWTVAIPLRNPIESAFGISYPARTRIIVRLTTDEGLTGMGETGPTALTEIELDDLAPRFLREVGPKVVGADPFHPEDLRTALGWTGDATAVELACFDIMGKATGRPAYQVLGGTATATPVPVAGYWFFKRPDVHGEGAVTPDNAVEAARTLVEQRGFRAIKLKLGVYRPEVEVAIVLAVRDALPHAEIRIDPNGGWSLPTALRVMRKLESADLEYVEDPTTDSSLEIPRGTSRHSRDMDGFRRLRAASRTPLCADGCYGLEQLRTVIREQAADVVLADVLASGGLRATVRWLQTAEVFHLGTGMHSGTELGIGQLAKLHAVTAVGGVTHATDAIYPEYVDDVLAGGKLEIRDGVMAVPEAPGLGRELDEQRLARWELTADRKTELDRYWRHLLAERGIDRRTSSGTVRSF